jgi:FkbM family methyltransferase
MGVRPICYSGPVAASALKSAIRGMLRLFGIEVFHSGSMVRLWPARHHVWGLEPTRDIAELLGSDIRTMVDVGANEGQTARDWIEHFPNAAVWAFEPHAASFARLSQLSAASTRIKAFQLALSDATGAGELHTNQHSTLGSLLPIRDSFPYGKPTGSEPITTERLDNFVAQNAVGTIDVLKLDTQGFELRVLRGAGSLLERGGVRALLVEVNFEPIYEGQAAAADILTLLDDAGFRLVCFYGMAATAEGLASWTDALFVHRAQP